MGIFDFLKGKNVADTKSNVQQNTSDTESAAQKKQKQNYFITNVEDFGFDQIELGISGKVRVDGIIAITEFQKQAEKKGVDFSYSAMYVSLLEEGALTVPIVINFGDKALTLYFIYNEDDLLKYKDLVNHVNKTAYPNLIYFSAIPIYDGYEPKKIIEPFQLADMRFEKDSKISGKYAMWWKSNEDDAFGNSETLNLLKKLYEVYKGYETYLVGYLIRQTKISSEMELKRMNLPDSPKNFVLVGPENKRIILDISQEKGIRFLFPISETTKAYRERFLNGVLVDFLSTRMYLQQNNVEEDEKKDPNSYDWFTFMSDTTVKNERLGEKIKMIGGMDLN